MAEVKKFRADGSAAGTEQLPDSVFGTRVRVQAVQQALLRQLANKRRAQPRTKTKAEVEGTGKKPHRQKGTGWARQGSDRNPHMPGGGRAHGPDGRLYTQDMGKKARRVALASLLTSKVRKGQLSVIEPVKLAGPKTADAMKIVDTMGFGDKKVLFVIPGPVAEFEKSVRNLRAVKTLACTVLNPHDLFTHDEIVLFQDSIAKIVDHLDPAKFRRGKAEA